MHQYVGTFLGEVQLDGSPKEFLITMSAEDFGKAISLCGEYIESVNNGIRGYVFRGNTQLYCMVQLTKTRS